MRTVIGVVIFIVVLIFAFVIFRSYLHGTRYPVAASVGSFVQGPYTIHGTAIIDESAGTPAVPWIRYLDSKNATSTKQLVYLDARACAPGAGDMPCVSPYHATDGYPIVTDGEPITATGYLYENRFLVTSISSDGS